MEPFGKGRGRLLPGNLPSSLPEIVHSRKEILFSRRAARIGGLRKSDNARVLLGGPYRRLSGCRPKVRVCSGRPVPSTGALPVVRVQKSWEEEGWGCGGREEKAFLQKGFSSLPPIFMPRYFSSIFSVSLSPPSSGSSTTTVPPLVRRPKRTSPASGSSRASRRRRCNGRAPSLAS